MIYGTNVNFWAQLGPKHNSPKKIYIENKYYTYKLKICDFLKEGGLFYKYECYFLI